MSLKLALIASPELMAAGRRKTVNEIRKEIEDGALTIAARLEEQDGGLYVVIESEFGNRRVAVKGRR